MTLAKIPWSIGDAVRVISTVAILVLLANALFLFVPLPFDKESNMSTLTFGLLMLQEILIVAPLYFLIIHRRGVKFSDFGFRSIRIRNGILWILKAYGMLFLFVILLTVFVSIAKWWPPGFGRQESHIPLFGTSPFDLGLAVIGLIFIAPVVEEIFFRGFLFQTLFLKLRPITAAIISAAIFSGIHLEFKVFGMMFVLGLILNWIFYRSRSLWPGIGFHIINNSLAFFLEWLVWKGYIMM